MADERIITGSTEGEIWQQLSKDFQQDNELLEYSAVLKQNNNSVILNIEIDPGGGFEGGYESTTLTAPLNAGSNFKFAIHHEGFLDEIGKFFGMQDVVIGYEEFDKNVVVKTNDEVKVKALFADDEARKIFQTLTGYTFSITDEGGQKFLELTIDRGITDPAELREVYHAYYTTLLALNNVK